MAACAHGADYESCPPKKVAKEFNKADKGTKLLKRAMSFKEWFIREAAEVDLDKTAAAIAKKHGVSVDVIKAQVRMGIKVEHEHTTDDKQAEKIALDHLDEMPDYYTKLNKMEKGACDDAESVSEMKDEVYYQSSMIAKHHGVPVTDVMAQIRKGKKVERKNFETDVEAQSHAIRNLKNNPYHYGK